MVPTASCELLLAKSSPTFLAPFSVNSTKIVSRTTLCTGVSIWAIFSLSRAITSGEPLRMMALRRRSIAIVSSTDWARGLFATSPFGGGVGLYAEEPLTLAEPKAGSRGVKMSFDSTGAPSVNNPTTSLTSAYLSGITSNPSWPYGRIVSLGGARLAEPGASATVASLAPGATGPTLRLMTLSPIGVAVTLAFPDTEKFKIRIVSSWSTFMARSSPRRSEGNFALIPREDRAKAIAGWSLSLRIMENLGACGEKLSRMRVSPEPAWDIETSVKSAGCGAYDVSAFA